MKYLVVLVFLCLLSQVGYAATIQGEVFDYALSPIAAQIAINSTPEQRIIADDGTYSFEVPQGVYTLESYTSVDNLPIAEQRIITVTDQGTYTIDLILLPTFEEEDFSFVDDFFEVVEQKDQDQNNSFPLLPILVLLAFLFVFGIIIKRRKQLEKPITPTKEESTPAASTDNDSLDMIIHLMRKNDGRMTQKEIRKHIPLSEAKISLMIAELEHKGSIEKIKKGRANILILKK